MSGSQMIIDLIKQSDSKFSKSQKRIAEYITNHYDTAAFMTAAKLAKVVDVSESTVVRFASELGYEGYPEFQRSLRELIKNKLTPLQRMEITSSQIGDKDVLKKVVQSDIDKLKQTLDTVNDNEFENAVDALTNARTVYILGARTCFSLASFLEVYLNMLLDNVKLVTANSASDVFEQMHRINSQDVLVAISYPRYSQRTFSGVQFAAERGAEIIAITDSSASPIVEYSSCSLIAGCDLGNFVDSLVAPLSLVNALIVAIVMRNKDKAVEAFDSLEDIWDKYHAYRIIKESNNSEE
ncbi:MAG: MurR/RpiR family transcriptional regulator [Clostridia bacterium]|nr:MurR/RpiR family transcriptional regulator [Clostridia bacterium]